MKLRIANLRLPSPEADLHLEAGRKLRLPPEEILGLEVVKSSVDARGRRPVRVVNLNVEVKDPEGTLARLTGDAQVMAAPPPKDGLYEGPRRRIGAQPVVVGTGPAGMFVTLALIEKGYRPLVIERGKPIRPRWKDVNAYWTKGELDPESKVVFGDGGAGTFSDGKLYTRRNDPRN